jgi:hypothetical protein
MKGGLIVLMRIPGGRSRAVARAKLSRARFPNAKGAGLLRRRGLVSQEPEVVRLASQ